MGATKQLFEDLRANISVPAEVYQLLKESEWDVEFKRFESEQLKELYKKDKEWVDANKTLIEAIQYREEIQSRIRVNNQIELYGC